MTGEISWWQKECSILMKKENSFNFYIPYFHFVQSKCQRENWKRMVMKKLLEISTAHNVVIDIEIKIKQIEQ